MRLLSSAIVEQLPRVVVQRYGVRMETQSPAERIRLVRQLAWELEEWAQWMEWFHELGQA